MSLIHKPKKGNLNSLSKINNRYMNKTNKKCSFSFTQNYPERNGFVKSFLLNGVSFYQAIVKKKVVQKW